MFRSKIFVMFLHVCLLPTFLNRTLQNIDRKCYILVEIIKCVLLFCQNDENYISLYNEITKFDYKTAFLHTFSLLCRKIQSFGQISGLSNIPLYYWSRINLQFFNCCKCKSSMSWWHWLENHSDLISSYLAILEFLDKSSNELDNPKFGKSKKQKIQRNTFTVLKTN